MKKLTIILLFFLTSCITVRVVSECPERVPVGVENVQPMKRSISRKWGDPGVWLVKPDNFRNKPGYPGFWLVEPVKTEN